MERHLFRFHQHPAVLPERPAPDSAAAEPFGVTVEHFFPGPRLRGPDPILPAYHRGEIAHHNGFRIRILSLPDKGNDAVVPVVAADPLKAGPVVIHLPEFRVVQVEMVQCPAVSLQFLMLGIIQQQPVQLLRIPPFDELAEFPAHEQQLLPGMAHPIPVKGPEPGKFLPVVPWHPVDERFFPMDHFVVGQGQDEVFRKSIVQGKGNQVLAPFPVQGIRAHVLEHVVHPAHVPFVVEAQASLIRRPGHQRPGGGFFRHHKGLGLFPEHRRVQLPEEFHCFQVLPSPVFVGLPLAVLFPVVQVQHAGHRVDPETVEMVFLQPEQGTGYEEAPYFRPAVVEVHGVPVLVFRQQGIPRFV